MDESFFQRAKWRKQLSFSGMMGKSSKIKRMEFDNDLLKKLYTNSALSDLELAELTAGATKNGCNNLC